VAQSRLWLAVEHEYGKPMGAILTELLLSKRMTQAQAARRLGVSQPTVSEWWAKVQAEPTKRAALNAAHTEAA
jgi:transcriptional regulator with XRE-family HTH domain